MATERIQELPETAYSSEKASHPQRSRQLYTLEEAIAIIQKDPEAVIKFTPERINLQGVRQQDLERLRTLYWGAIGERFSQNRRMVDAYDWGQIHVSWTLLQNLIPNKQRTLAIHDAGCGSGDSMIQICHLLEPHFEKGDFERVQIVSTDSSPGMISRVIQTARELNQRYENRINVHVHPQPLDLLLPGEIYQEKFQTVLEEAQIEELDATLLNWVVGYLGEKDKIKAIKNAQAGIKEGGIVELSSLTHTLVPGTETAHTMEDILMWYGMAQFFRHLLPDPDESLLPNPKRAKKTLESVNVEKSVGHWVASQLFPRKPTTQELKAVAQEAGLSQIKTDKTHLLGASVIMVGRIGGGPPPRVFPGPISIAFKNVEAFADEKSISPFKFARMMAQQRKGADSLTSFLDSK